MKGNHTMSEADPRLDWRPRHDPRSREFPIRTLIGTEVPQVRRLWRAGPVLDQGREGACVGFGWTSELLSLPKTQVGVSSMDGNQFAQNVYRRAQQIDEWDGESYEGTSVLAGAKVIREMGLIGEYRWCFSVEDVRDTIIQHGPVVIGINWYDDMYETDYNGMVKVSGPMVGGHCILVTGYDPSFHDPEDDNKVYPVFRWRNSWGRSYGLGGNAWIRYEDMRNLLADQGEACTPVERKSVKGI